MTNLLHTTENDQKTQEQGTIVERDVAINNDATCSQCERCRIASIPCVVYQVLGDSNKSSVMDARIVMPCVISPLQCLEYHPSSCLKPVFIAKLHTRPVYSARPI